MNEQKIARFNGEWTIHQNGGFRWRIDASDEWQMPDHSWQITPALVTALAPLVRSAVSPVPPNRDADTATAGATAGGGTITAEVPAVGDDDVQRVLAEAERIEAYVRAHPNDTSVVWQDVRSGLAGALRRVALRAQAAGRAAPNGVLVSAEEVQALCELAGMFSRRAGLPSNADYDDVATKELNTLAGKLALRLAERSDAAPAVSPTPAVPVSPGTAERKLTPEEHREFEAVIAEKFASRRSGGPEETEPADVNDIPYRPMPPNATYRGTVTWDRSGGGETSTERVQRWADVLRAHTAAASASEQGQVPSSPPARSLSDAPCPHCNDEGVVCNQEGAEVAVCACVARDFRRAGLEVVDFTANRRNVILTIASVENLVRSAATPPAPALGEPKATPDPAGGHETWCAKNTLDPHANGLPESAFPCTCNPSPSQGGRSDGR